MKYRLIQHTFLILFIIIFFGLDGTAQQNDNNISSIEEYRNLRKNKLNKSRNLIHNNDGNDVIYYPADHAFSVKNLMDMRSSGLIGTDVTTLSYTTIASGFGNFTHQTNVGEMLLEHGYEFGIQNEARNVTTEMLDIGTDPLRENVKFAHENNMEIFWSNRINDTHDAAHRSDKPYYLWTDFKENHPEYLFGKEGEQLPNGRWSSLDFDNEEVRERCVQFYKEVCENYNVDGIELDFFRHFELFESVGRGGTASENQLNKLTDMLRDIRTVTEQAGMKRGNPILVLVRLPTSPDFARRAGVDIVRWIDEGLVDIVVGSGYFRLDFWENFVKIGNEQEVKIYAGLSESRVKGEHPLMKRQQNAVFRARAAAAWEAGVDGLYSFNEYDTRVKYLSQIGVPEQLHNTNNFYFVTYRDYSADRYLADGNRYFKTPRLTPSPYIENPLKSEPLSFKIEIGDESVDSKVFLPIWVENVHSENLRVSLNGAPASFVSATNDGVHVFEIDHTAVKPGINELQIGYSGRNDHGDIYLKDAGVFFCRDTKDIELRDLISLCTSENRD